MRALSVQWAAVAAAGLCSLACLPERAAAQQPTELPAITVQGATLEARPTSRVSAQPSAGQPADSAAAELGGDAGGVPLDKIGSAVTVVTGAQLQAQQVRHAGDALRSLPGVAVGRSGGPGNLTQVRIRGAEANHTLVLVDGIEANATSDGDFDYATLLTEDIERIEVIRGPQSGLYGSKAIGGVINIITKSGKGPFTATLRAEGGAYGTSDFAARFSGGTDKAWVSVGIQERSQLYFNNAPIGAEQDAWRNTTASVKGGFTIMNGLVLDYTVRDVRRRLNFDSDLVPPGGLLTRQTDTPNVSELGTFLGGINLKWDTLDGALTHVVRANRNVTDVRSVTQGFFGGMGYSDNHSELNKVGYLATYRFATPMFLAAKHSVSGLIERELESFRPFSSDPPGPFTPDGVERDRSRMAHVGEYRGEFFDRLSVTGTIRRDDNDKNADFTTWRSTASLGLREIAMRPHASIGTGVALPGMFEQFGSVIGVFVGNPNLKPEESRGWDAGVEFTLVPNRAFLDVTYFRADLTNEITGFGKTLTNLPGKSERSGTELALRTQLVPWLYLGAAYTFLDAREPDGQEEIRRPRHAGRADVTYLFDRGRGTFNVAAVYNGDMKDRNFGTFPATVVTLDNYWLVSSALSYKLQPGIEAFGRVENLLNEKYEEVSGYNTPGISAFAGLKFTFGGPEGIGTPWKQ